MRLTRLVRVGLALTGAALIALGCVGAAFDWSGGALAFIVAGVVLLVGALVGVFPRGSIKEGTIEWPEVDKHPRVDAIEAEVAALQDEIAKARDETSAASGLLLDYILAHLPEPDDDLAAEERVERFEEVIAELSREIDWRYFTGETYDDGIDVRQLERGREANEKDLKREERRQSARTRFGLPVDESAH
jgi:hypothetical protein